MNSVIEYPECINDCICDNIVDLFEDHGGVDSVFTIPKHDNSWNKIEMLVYKELLLKFNEYKNTLLCLNEKDIFTENLVVSLNKTLYLKDFVIQTFSDKKEKCVLHRENSRYHLITFVVFLKDGGEMVFDKKKRIKAEQSKLVLFPDNTPYEFHSLSEKQYVITGQIGIQSKFT